MQRRYVLKCNLYDCKDEILMNTYLIYVKNRNGKWELYPQSLEYIKHTFKEPSYIFNINEDFCVKFYSDDVLNEIQKKELREEGRAFHETFGQD